MSIIKRVLLAALSAHLLAGQGIRAAEFEVLDRFSVDGYTVLKGSADIPGGSFTVGGSTLVVKNGNVGVGTASPAAQIDVCQPLSSMTTAAITTGSQMSGLRLGNAGSAVNDYKTGIWANQGGIQSGIVFGRQAAGWGSFVAFHTRPAAIADLDNLIERVRIDSDGNVGIGTTGPVARLQVNGDILLENNQNYSMKDDAGSIRSLVNTAGDGSVHYNGYHGSEIIRAVNGTTYFLDSGGNGLVKMTIAGGGYVGIGTASPQTALEINAGTYASQKLLTLAGSEATRYSGNIGFGDPNSSNSFGLHFGTRNNNIDYDNTLNILNGNVGIGTTGPTLSLLQVGDGTGTKYVTVSGANGDIYVGSSNNNAHAGITNAIKIIASSAGNPLVISNNQNAPLVLGTSDLERVRILGNGNVGIGTAGPGAKLDISGDLYINGAGGMNQHSAGYSVDSGIREMFRVTSAGLCTGGTFTISGTRGGFVHTSQWAWSSTHNSSGRGVLTQLSSGEYSNITVYLDVKSDGSVIVSANWGSAQGYNISIQKTAGSAIDVSLVNADRSSPDTGYARIAVNTMTGLQTTRDLTVLGGAWVTSGVWSGSDERWKKDITPLTDPLGKVMRLQGVSFNWKTDEFPELNFSTAAQIGLIAQDAEKVMPEVVTTDNRGYKGISYEKLAPVLIEAIKKQQQKISELELKIIKLEDKNN